MPGFQLLRCSRFWLGSSYYQFNLTSPGRHQPIIDRATFDAVQTLLAHKSHMRRSHVSKARSALLYRRLFDGDAQSMEPLSFSRRGGKAYRYYASLPLHGDQDDHAIRRVPATAAERFVVQQLARILGLSEDDLNQSAVRSILIRAEVHASSVQLVMRLGPRPDAGERVTLDGIKQALHPGEEMRRDPADQRLVCITFPTRLKVHGGRSWVADAKGQALRGEGDPDAWLIRRLRRAHRILVECSVHPAGDADPLILAKAPSNFQQAKLARLAFLAPDIQQAILEGRCGGERWRRPDLEIPLSWARQREVFGFGR
jgi:site-specific DNA recombinase